VSGSGSPRLVVVAPSAWIAPGLLVVGAVLVAAAGASSARTAYDAAARDARAALGARVDAELARAADRLRGIVSATRDRGVFEGVPFPLDVRAVAASAPAAPRTDALFAEAERLEFQAHDLDASIAELRRVASAGEPLAAARAAREEGRILLALGRGGDAAVPLRRAAATEGADERDVLLARFALLRCGGDVGAAETSLRADLAAGAFGSVAPEERLAMLRELRASDAQCAALAALVALRDAADPATVVTAGDAHVAWQLERREGTVRLAVAPLDEFAAGLVPAARDGLVGVRAAPGARAPRPMPALAFDPSALALASFAAEGAAASRTRWIPAAAISLAFAAGAFVTWRGARARAELDARKDAFLCAVTHELKTPIANVLLYAETLNAHGASDPASVPKFTGTIASEALRLEARVAEMLDVASGRAGVPRGDERFDAALVVRDVTTEFAERAAGCGVPFEAQVADGASFVLGSPRMLRRALAAVVENAFAFAPAGPVRIESSRASGRLRIAVEDGGPGIRSADRERVFEPFVRLGDERTREVPGTGLGLTLARQGVAACGGTIRCEGREPGGARFVIEVPEA
jgi:signal transduction histidine kinase